MSNHFSIENAKHNAIKNIFRELGGIENRFKVIKNQLTFLESKHDYCSILDYCEKHDCRLPIYIVGELDFKANSLSHKRNIPIGRAAHKIFGCLNLYRYDLLDEVMREED